MAFTVEEWRDLIRLLEERPEWRAELRRLLLSDELVSLPEQIAALRLETERRFQELITQVGELTRAHGRLEERMTRLEERMIELALAHQRLEERMTELTLAHQRLEERMTELALAHQRLEERMTELAISHQRLTDDVGELKGDNLERRYRERAGAYFGRLVRRAHVLSMEELSDLLEEAIARGVLSEAEAEEVTWADLVVRGRRREDDVEVFLVVEISWGVGPQDVERAARRAALLARAGLSTLPAVAGKAITDDATHMAQTRQVWQVLDGRVTS